MATAIRFDRVSKQFTLHTQRASSFQEIAVNLLRWRGGASRQLYWALRDVSFEIPAGASVALIGANGAGKSTVLKLMTQIIQPTAGRIEVTGRISALVELGVGFHPDLTGRENIFLNASILGMSRSQIRAKLDDIIDFAELERFIDVPVKHYSSGMYVRLGFATAVHTDPDILLVDEVLAVGDQAFQKKCIAQIQSLKHQGVTIVFVTHNLELTRNISDRVIWLKSGQIAGCGTPADVIRDYIRFQDEVSLAASGPASTHRERSDFSAAHFESVVTLDKAGNPARSFGTGDEMTIRLGYVARERICRPIFGVSIFRDDGLRINGPNTRLAGYEIESIEGHGYVDYVIPQLPLLNGRYTITAGLFDEFCAIAYDLGYNLACFDVRPAPEHDYAGFVYIPAQWKHTPL
jgi:ABC-type polysaccharide/polyol phosphate transport system ATPase subunit